MTSNFGGKKAAPFRKGGKPRKAIVAKAVVAKAKRAKREMALSVITGREIDLGRDGSKWRHGWIPLNPQAVALKAHHSKGGTGVDNPAEHMAKIREHVAEAARRAATQSEGIAAHTDQHVGPNGWGRVRVEKKIDAHGTRTTYRIQTNENAGMHGPAITSAEKAAVALHRHLYGAPKDNSEKTAWRAGAPASEPGGKSELEKAFDAEGMARDTYGHGSKQHEAARAKRMAIEAQVKKSDPGYTTGTGRTKSGVSSDLSPQAKIDNAETMHGTGSKQHLAALARFGTESQKRAAAYQIREGNPKTRTTGIGQKKVTELTSIASPHAKTPADFVAGAVIAHREGKDYHITGAGKVASVRKDPNGGYTVTTGVGVNTKRTKHKRLPPAIQQAMFHAGK